jgi:hypothetical protein
VASFTFAREPRGAFERDGFIRFPAAFARADAERMQDEWWAELADVHGMRRDDRSTWRGQLDLKRPKAAPSQRLIETDTVRAVVDGLLGVDAWDWPKDWGRPIVTFPSGAPVADWDVPKGWHWDGRTAWNRERPINLLVVACVGEVAPRGGGTLVVAGSPRVILDQYKAIPAPVRGLGETWYRDRLNRDHPWFARLSGHAPGPEDRIGAFMSEDAPLRVVELTGEPGDMVFCHPLLVHSGAPNCREVPRMVRIKQQFMSREAKRMLKLEMNASQREGRS